MKRALLFLGVVSTALGQVAAPPEALNNWPTANTALTLADPGFAGKVAGWNNTTHKWEWVNAGGGTGIASDTFWAAKGDLAVATANDAASVLTVGTANQVLTVDSTTATGLKWATPASGGTGTVTNAASLADTALVVGDGGTVGIKTIAGYTVGTTGAVTNNLGANALTGLTMKRFTDSGQTGNFLDFKNAAGTSLWTTNISGTLTAGAVPETRISYSNPAANTIRVWDNTTLVGMTNATIGTGLLYTTGTPPSLAVSSNLATISGLTATTDNFIVGVASAWASRTPTQVRTTLGLTIGTDVQAFDADLTTWAGITPGTGVGTFLATPSSANLRAAVSDENGTGVALFNGATTPDFTTGITIGGAAGSRKVLVGDGTKFAASTETYAVPGTSGNLLTSDGTNWTSAAPVVSASSTTTLTNKRINPRVTSVASNATWSPNADTDDEYNVYAQAAAVTTISNPSGTPVEGQKLIIRVKDNGTARAISGWGANYRFSSDLPAPGTTVISKGMYLGFIYTTENSTVTKWDCVAIIQNF